MIVLTARDAKEISLRVWRYFAAHPEAENKRCLPVALFSLVEDMALNCPLCEFFFQHADPLRPCDSCPLVSCNDGSAYQGWARSKSYDERALYAKRIVASIEAWDIDALPFL